MISLDSFLSWFLSLSLIEVVPVTCHCSWTWLTAVDFVDQCPNIIVVGRVFVVHRYWKTQVAFLWSRISSITVLSAKSSVLSVIHWVCGSPNKAFRVCMKLLWVLNVFHSVKSIVLPAKHETRLLWTLACRILSSNFLHRASIYEVLTSITTPLLLILFRMMSLWRPTLEMRLTAPGSLVLVSLF